MKQLKFAFNTTAIVTMTLFGTLVLAIDQYDYPALMKKGDLGTLSLPEVAQRIVRINAGQRYLNVERNETIKIENSVGQSFTWKFDTLGERNFPLTAISPRGFEASNVVVYVSNPYTYNSD